MITYTWSISRLDCAPSENGLTNVVKVINWGLKAQDENGYSAECSNSYPLSSPSSEEFFDYSTLTKETVIGWLESNLDVDYLQMRLSNEIASQHNPPIISLPLPWENVSIEQTLEEKIADGYNPDARDGDGDGIVQEGTEWERPIDTEI